MFYGVDEETDSLNLVPMVARRALDLAGCKLSLEGWQSLALDARRRLCDLGAADTVNAAVVWTAVSGATPPPKRIDVVPDAPIEAPPRQVIAAFGADRPIPPGTWGALSRLDRFVLTKVAAKPRANRLALAYEEIIGASGVSPHLEPLGGARMVGVTEKPETLRIAVAESWVSMQADTFGRLSRRDVAKGDVLGTARLAAIAAVKRTPDLVPLCHPLRVTRVDVECELEASRQCVRITATVQAVDRTGVEMEALTAAMTGALNVYDMLKAYDRGMQIGPTRLVSKSGGRSGDWQREADR